MAKEKTKKKAKKEKTRRTSFKGFIKSISVPTRKELLKDTLMVFVTMAVVAVVIFGVDTLFTEIYMLVRGLITG